MSRKAKNGISPWRYSSCFKQTWKDLPQDQSHSTGNAWSYPDRTGSLDPFDATGTDIGGNTNVLTGTHLCGEGQSAWNTVNVKIEKWTGKSLTPDYTWKPVYVAEG